MTSTRSKKLCLAQQPDADEMLSRDPFALLIGMLLDQQIPMERAFAGPVAIAQRMEGPFDPSTVATYDPDGFVEVVVGPCGDPPLPDRDGRADPDPGQAPGRGVRR